MIPEWMTFRWKWNALLFAATGVVIMVYSQFVRLAAANARMDVRGNPDLPPMLRNVRVDLTVWGRVVAGPGVEFQSWFSQPFLQHGWGALQWAAVLFVIATVVGLAAVAPSRPSRRGPVAAGLQAVAAAVAAGATASFWWGARAELASPRYIAVTDTLWLPLVIPALGALCFALGAWHAWRYRPVEHVLPALPSHKGFEK